MNLCRPLLYGFAIASLLLGSCTTAPEVFKEVDAKVTGITFENALTPTDDLNILDYLYFYNGGGVAVGDINNDGLADIYFSGNQTPNKLYLNKGNLRFEDITEKAGVAGRSQWNTGAVMADVNGDGLLDIYVCAVVGLKGLRGHNELYINNGDGTFTERSAQYGLDLDTYSANAAFFDYDLDGDLDMYLLNHAVHTQESFGRASLREDRRYESGDRLFRNDGERFTDVSESAGIYGGVNGYGLGLAIADFNRDGYPDIYVGNDFHEDDYYYLNQGDGTFKESIKDYFGHISRFSMGNDVADLNHDGYPDLLSLDMLPEEEVPLKASEGDDNVQMLKMRTQNLGYHYQFTRNMLQVNQGGNFFSEQALMSGVAATDWSWSALFSDYNLDGELDVFIANGIPKRPNDLDYIRYVSNEQIQQKISNTSLVDQKALDMMPSGITPNYVFEGSRSLEFTNRTGSWIPGKQRITTAIAVGDLDNDGDPDLVLNNLNEPAVILENKMAGNNEHHALGIKLEFDKKNPFGIGSRVLAYTGGTLHYRELNPYRGFQASSQPRIHLGTGTYKSIDSIRVIWPDQTTQRIDHVPAQGLLTIKADPGRTPYHTPRSSGMVLFEKDTTALGITYTHKEDNYLDFNSQKLIPYRISDRGPATAIGDLNGDGKDDIYFGASKFFPASVYVSADTSFTYFPVKALKDSVTEDVSALIADLNNDHKNDLLVGTGGGNFFGKSAPLRDRIFLNTDNGLKAQLLDDWFANTSVVRVADIDKDGDLDIFTGNHAITYEYGHLPDSQLWLRDNDTLIPAFTGLFEKAGMITDAQFTDLNGDGWTDLVIVGEWMQPRFFMNHQGELREESLTDTSLKGLWQKVMPFDIDRDGDLDLMLANWGTNTKFKANEKYPLHMYYGDLDDNGSTETIVSMAKNGTYYPLENFDELASQMNSFMRKAFHTYSAFAGKSTEEVFGKEALKNSSRLEVNELRSGYLLNENGNFKFVPFSRDLQMAPLTAFAVYDFNGDGQEDLLAGGNYFGVKPYHGRFDGFPGALITKAGEETLTHGYGLDLNGKSVRHLHIIQLNNQTYLLVTVNDGPAEVYHIKKP